MSSESLRGFFMLSGVGRLVSNAAKVALLGLCLAACNTTSNSLSDSFDLKDAPAGAGAFAAVPETDALPPLGEPTPEGALLGSNSADDLATGKSYFRAGNFGMAERYFRRATELHPQDAEAWLDLAASYDRLRRFDLADRAYGQAIRLAGIKVEILNNQGYSYMLRGDVPRAYEKLSAARQRDPRNPYVLSNLRLLHESTRRGKAIE